MKHFFSVQVICWTVLLVCLTSAFSVAQLVAQHGPFKGANRITITSNMADRETAQAISQVLSDQSIAYSVDGSVWQIRSQTNSGLAGKGYIFEGQMQVNTGVIKLSGQLVNAAQPANKSFTAKAMPIVFTRRESSLQGMGFLYMQDLAKKLQSALHGVLVYEYKKDPI